VRELRHGRGAGDPKAVKSTDGKYFDAKGDPTYNVGPGRQGGLLYTFSGYRRYHAECHVCHGPNGGGSTYAPALKDSVKRFDYAEFAASSSAAARTATASCPPSPITRTPLLYRRSHAICARSDGPSSPAVRGRRKIARKPSPSRRDRVHEPEIRASIRSNDPLDIRRRGFSALLSTGWAAAILSVAAPPRRSMGPDFGAKGDDNQGSIELVDPKTLRVCADPNNLPFKRQGRRLREQNREFLAKKLGKDLAYTYYPGATGFVRNTLNAHLCDVILGMPQGNDLVQSTNPYYRTTYAIVTRADSELDGVKSLDDPRLKEKPHRIGLVANTPPGNVLAMNGLMASVKPYALMVDTRVESSGAAMMHDLEKGEIDVALLWGPIAGYYAKHSRVKQNVTPLPETLGARMACIGFVRHSDQN
jgi:quinoprotein dehydrogenase-associated probable ABC transporter substrate-binding protein